MTAERKSRKSKHVSKSRLPDKVSVEQLKPLLTETQFKYFSLYAQGLSGVEIAELFNVSPSVVSRGISRAKHNLTSAMKAGYVFNQAAGRNINI
ncbi:MAG: hypothetical protein E7430_03290 [Ruminococcaceae bacterium]|nr:hypothetical protein [Oscillospiraceae bacterium]